MAKAPIEMKLRAIVDACKAEIDEALTESRECGENYVSDVRVTIEGNRHYLGEVTWWVEILDPKLGKELSSHYAKAEKAAHAKPKAD